MPLADNLLLLRADGGPSIGAGHVMRSLALGHAWEEAGGQVLLASHERPDFYDSQPDTERVPSVDIPAAPGSRADAEFTARIAQERGAAWVAIDGYHFDVGYQGLVRDVGVPVLVVDDNAHRTQYRADLLLNPNLHAGRAMYPSLSAETQVLLGPRYALLRRRFWPWAQHPARYPEIARRLLISLGGSGSYEFARWLLEALEPLAAEDLRVVLAAALSDEQRASLVRPGYRGEGRLQVVAGVRDVPRAMARAELALSAAGSTCWELAFMGVPTLVLSLADNQRAVARGLDQAGAALDLGWHADLDASRLRDAVHRLARSASARRSMGERGRLLVDGQGGHRVVMVMIGDPIRLRPANPDDLFLLWHWANDPEVRASAMSQDPISLTEHRRWFAARLSDPKTFMFVALDGDDHPVGQVRFNLVREGEVEIDVSVDPERRGQGIGWKLIGMASDRLLSTYDLTRIHAFVRQDNQRSARAFAKAGFLLIGVDETHGTPMVHWMLSRES